MLLSCSSRHHFLCSLSERLRRFEFYPDVLGELLGFAQCKHEQRAAMASMSYSALNIRVCYWVEKPVFVSQVKLCGLKARDKDTTDRSTWHLRCLWLPRVDWLRTNCACRYVTAGQRDNEDVAFHPQQSRYLAALEQMKTCM